MLPDFSDIFEEYKTLRSQADGLFAHVASQYPQCVKCQPGCADCCHALFDLSLVEAMHINFAFQKTFGHGPARSSIVENASRLDRALTKIKREMFLARKAGAEVEDIMAQAAAKRMACPLLGHDDRCLLYEERPITCRLYGIPVEIGGKSHACCLSGFDPGQKYPAVHLAKIQDRLEELSGRIAERCGSRFNLTDIYVPLSMALLTKYDDAYLGIGNAGLEN